MLGPDSPVFASPFLGSLGSLSFLGDGLGDGNFLSGS